MTKAERQRARYGAFVAEETIIEPESSRDALGAAWQDGVGEPNLPELASRGHGDRLIAQAFGACEVL